MFQSLLHTFLLDVSLFTAEFSMRRHGNMASTWQKIQSYNKSQTDVSKNKTFQTFTSDAREKAGTLSLENKLFFNYKKTKVSTDLERNPGR